MGLDISLIVPDYEVEVFNRGITHNLNKMAEAVGIYKHLWRPEEYCVKYLEIQTRGIQKI